MAKVSAKKYEKEVIIRFGIGGKIPPEKFIMHFGDKYKLMAERKTKSETEKFIDTYPGNERYTWTYFKTEIKSKTPNKNGWHFAIYRSLVPRKNR